VNDIPVKKMELKRKTIDVTEDEMEDVDPGGRNVYFLWGLMDSQHMSLRRPFQTVLYLVNDHQSIPDIMPSRYGDNERASGGIESK